MSGHLLYRAVLASNSPLAPAPLYELALAYQTSWGVLIGTAIKMFGLAVVVTPVVLHFIDTLAPGVSFTDVSFNVAFAFGVAIGFTGDGLRVLSRTLIHRRTGLKPKEVYANSSGGQDAHRATEAALSSGPLTRRLLTRQAHTNLGGFIGFLLMVLFNVTVAAWAGAV